MEGWNPEVPAVPTLQDLGGWSRYSLLFQCALRTALGLGGRTAPAAATSSVLPEPLWRETRPGPLFAPGT